MAILAWLRKIQRTLHQCADAIRNAEERKRKGNMPSNSDPLEVKAVVSLDEKTMANFAAQNQSTNPTQNSIKKATWAAFYAVSAYAVVTAFMWCAMIQQNKIANRALQQSTDAFRLDERA